MSPYLQNLTNFASAGQPQQTPYQVGMTALNMGNNGGLSAMPPYLTPETFNLLKAIFSQPGASGSAPAQPQAAAAPAQAAAAQPAASSPAASVNSLVSAGVQPSWNGQNWVMPTGTIVNPGSANGPQFVNGNWQWANGQPATFGGTPSEPAGSS